MLDATPNLFAIDAEKLCRACASHKPTQPDVWPSTTRETHPFHRVFLIQGMHSRPPQRVPVCSHHADQDEAMLVLVTSRPKKAVSPRRPIGTESATGRQPMLREARALRQSVRVVRATCDACSAMPSSRPQTTFYVGAFTRPKQRSPQPGRSWLRSTRTSPPSPNVCPHRPWSTTRPHAKWERDADTLMPAARRVVVELFPDVGLLRIP